MDVAVDALSTDLRNRLAATIKAARRAGESGARNALGMLAVGDARAHASMSPAEQHLRRRLRAHGRQLGDRHDADTGVQAIDRLVHEVAYEHWHRMLFARFLAENHLLIEPESGVAVSLAECEELAREQGQDRWTLAGRFAASMLPRIFRSDDPALEVRLAPETRQELERLIESLPTDVFTARDSLGWTYQFWQAERKDAVNKSGVKIGADELPAVTQLFTERYMVLFLLHNTIGAWRAGKLLEARSELAATAASEEELRDAVRLEGHGGYDFSYLRFVREPRAGDEAEQPTGSWRPAAGSFEGWPRPAAELRVLDPCCGSGHFLIESLDLLVRLRMEEDHLAPGDAIDAVLRDNLFGLEIDPRCTQIAAFNLALTAWTWPGAGGYRRLPDLNLACSGLAPNAPRDEWTRLSEDAADAGGLPPERDLFGVDDTLLSAPLRNSLGALHDLFAQAPVLGSLIDPRAVEADLYQHDYESVRVLLGALLKRERGSDEQTERAVAAQGMARAAELLAGRYHLVVTNVPCLAPVSGESWAADRLRQLVAAAYGDDWSTATERQLLVATAANSQPSESIEEWLRDRFFEEHCKLFHQRPFIWHVWDGRRDGFHALVNYHRLVGPNGEARRTLEALTYSHLGNWMARQKVDWEKGVDGADGRLVAAQDLRNQLEKILVAEPPCDLFVRWKPLGEQPIGWEPDINDGVRVNIRPFMSAELAKGGRAGAGILRAKPKIAWGKDRGTEALKPRKRWKPPWLDDDHEADVDQDRELRPREDYPWFWGCRGGGTLTERTDFPGSPDFDGSRWNDLHYTTAFKRVARARKRSEVSP